MVTKPNTLFDKLTTTSIQTQQNAPSSSTANASIPKRIPFSQAIVEARVKQTADAQRYRLDRNPEDPRYLFAALNPITAQQNPGALYSEDELYKFVKYYVDAQGLLTDRWAGRSDSFEKQVTTCKAELNACRKRNTELEAELDACRKRNAELEAELDACRKRNAELEALPLPTDEFANTKDGKDDELATEKSSNLLWWVLGASAVAGGGYYIYRKNKS